MAGPIAPTHRSAIAAETAGGPSHDQSGVAPRPRGRAEVFGRELGPRCSARLLKIHVVPDSGQHLRGNAERKRTIAIRPNTLPRARPSPARSACLTVTGHSVTGR